MLAPHPRRTSVIRSRVVELCLWALAGVLIDSRAHAGPWVGASPGAGGAFTAIGAGPSGIILCGSDLGGAYRSLDRGLSWEAIGPSRGLNAVHVSAVAFDR